MSITLDYGPQGEQQAGDAIVLRYGAAGALRRVSTGVRAPWARTVVLSHDVAAPYTAQRSRDHARTAPWGEGAALDRATASVWGISTVRDRRRHLPWGRYARAPAVAPRAPWGVATPRDRGAGMPWGVYARTAGVLPRMPWGVARPTDTARVLPWGTWARARTGAVVAPYVRARRRDLWRRWPWGTWSRPLAPNWGVVIEDGEPDRDPDTGQILIPVRRVYLVSNSANLILQPSGDVLPLRSMTVSIDADSWTWELRASLHGSAFDQLRRTGGDPVEVEAQVNGYQLRFIVESATRSREFNQRTVNITGRGHAAWLAGPYAPTEAHAPDTAKTAQQLILDALEFTDWSVGWQLDDWNVPAGAFSLRGTPMDVATRVATAAGGIVQADRTAKTLHLLPRYPTPPWDWDSATPDVQVPLEIVTTDSIEDLQRPTHNVVYVSGESQGVVGRVLRSGSAADKPAPQVTDALITELAAARQRGTAILADTGAQLRQQITLPVTDEAPLLEIGWLTECVDPDETLLGLVRGISLRVQRQGTGALVVRQSAELEVH